MGGSSSSESKEGPKAEPVDLKKLFDKLDVDKNGTLSKEEIKTALKQTGKTDEEIKKQITLIGTRSGVTYDEFKTVMEGKQLPAEAAPPPPAETPAAEPKAKAKADSKKEKGKAKSEGSKGKGKEKGKEEKGKAKDKGGEKGGKAFTPPSGPFGSGSGFRLNVKNLPEDVDDAKLKEMFEPFGTVTAAQVKLQDNKKSRGFGFVVLSSEEEGQKAIEEMNAKETGGKTISVVPAERREAPADAMEVKGKGKGGKGSQKGKAESVLQHQQAMAAAYMQQYQQYYYLQQMAYVQQQQQQAGGGGGGAAPAGQEFEGSLKSISGKNGYGFIVCQETFAIYSRDVYVDADVLPQNAKVADRLKFSVELNAKGHPRATTCRLAIS